MNPKKVGSNKYPTGQQLNVSLALADNKHRWQRSAKLINDIVEKIPSTKIDVPKEDAPKVTKSEKRTATLKANKRIATYLMASADFELPKNFLANEMLTMQINAAKYVYQVDSSLMDIIMRQFENILTEEILGGSDFWTQRFFLNQNINEAVVDGTTDSFDSAIRITAGSPVESSMQLLNVQQQLQSPQYIDRLRMVNGRVFESMKGLTGDMKSQLRLTLTEGMARGLSVVDLKGIINKRLGVGMSRAERIARTEINQAYNQAYIDESVELNDTALKDDDWHIALAQRSALSGTTRPSHGARHGRIFTAQQMRDWWSVDGNAIQCLCTTLDVLQNRETGEILQQTMIDNMKAQKGKWFPS